MEINQICKKSVRLNAAFFYNRFIGTGIKVSYEQRQRSASRYFSTDMSIGQMELLECLFPTDFHSFPPHYTEVNSRYLFL